MRLLLSSFKWKQQTCQVISSLRICMRQQLSTDDKRKVAVLQRERPMDVSNFNEEQQISYSSLQHGPPLSVYEKMVSNGELMNDPIQRDVMKQLDHLSERLSRRTYPGKEVDTKMELVQAARGEGVIPSLLAYIKGETSMRSAQNSRKRKPKGLYLHGGPGTGKTFMLDLFYNECPLEDRQKIRVHFLEFMTSVHQQLHLGRKRGARGRNLIDAVVHELMAGGEKYLLCFDEFQVTNVADAMVIRQLFSTMWERGLVMVATSNRPPQHLYHNGLQRELFLPFISDLKTNCKIYSLASSTIDYRLVHSAKSEDADEVFLAPINDAIEKRYQLIWEKLTNGVQSVSLSLPVGNRHLEVNEAIIGNRMARFSFHELCGRPLGPDDYRVLGNTFHTIFLGGVPVFTLQALEPLRRFILLIDTLYERRVKLIVMAEAKLDELFLRPKSNELKCSSSLKEGGKNVHSEPDEAFAFDRTMSRLKEMGGSAYLMKSWVPTGPDFLIQFEGKKLSEPILRLIWKRYNLDGSSALERNELLALLEDLMQVKSGHRNVPDETLEWIYAEMDPQGTGCISEDAFLVCSSVIFTDNWWGGLKDEETDKANSSILLY